MSGWRWPKCKRKPERHFRKSRDGDDTANNCTHQTIVVHIPCGWTPEQPNQKTNPKTQTWNMEHGRKCLVTENKSKANILQLPRYVSTSGFPIIFSWILTNFSTSHFNSHWGSLMMYKGNLASTMNKNPNGKEVWEGEVGKEKDLSVSR